MENVQFDNNTPKKKNILKIILLVIVGMWVFSALCLLLASFKYGGIIFLALIGWGIWYVIQRFRKKTDQKIIKKSVVSNSPQSAGISINGTCTIQNPYAGILIVGGAGSGKSKSLVEPIIKAAGQQEYCGIVYDFKFPELAMYVETAYQNSSIKRYYVDFDQPHDRLNPIAPNIMRNSTFAREFAKAILQNINPQSVAKPDFWSDNAELILSAVFWFLRQELPEMCTLPHAISLIMSGKTEQLIKLLKTNTETADMISPLSASIEAKAGEQTAGILSSLQVSLNKINTPEIYYVCGATQGENLVNLDLNNSDNRAILTIGNNPTLAQTYSPVIGLIITAASKLLNRHSKAHSMILVDEFPTLVLPNIEQIPATARSNKVATILAAQDISQVVDKYGKQKADTIFSNLGNQFYGRTPNPETAKRVSSLFGRADKLMESTSTSKGRSTGSGFIGNKTRTNSTSQSYQERDLVKAQDVATLATGSFYVQLSEGVQKQGKISVPMDGNFGQTAIPSVQVTEEDIRNEYNRIKEEAKALLKF